MEIVAIATNIYKCKRGQASARRCNARAANVPGTLAAWNNADEGGEWRAARVPGSFAALASCAWRLPGHRSPSKIL